MRDAPLLFVTFTSSFLCVNMCEASTNCLYLGVFVWFLLFCFCFAYITSY